MVLWLKNNINTLRAALAARSCLGPRLVVFSGGSQAGVVGAGEQVLAASVHFYKSIDPVGTLRAALSARSILPPRLVVWGGDCNEVCLPALPAPHTLLLETIPNGGLRAFHPKSTYWTKLTLWPYLVSMWSHASRGNLHRGLRMEFRPHMDRKSVTLSVGTPLCPHGTRCSQRSRRGAGWDPGGVGRGLQRGMFLLLKRDPIQQKPSSSSVDLVTPIC